MSDFLKVYKDTKIYVVCPPGIKSGGPEALHQLVYYLNVCNLNAYIAYFDTDNDYEIIFDYRKYVENWVHGEDISDNKHHIVIFPEGSACLDYYSYFKKAKKAVWFLSIYFYRGYCRTPEILKERMRSLMRRILIEIYSIFKGNYSIRRKDCLNLAASYYAFDYISKKGGNPKIFIEPVSLEILDYIVKRDYSFENADKREDIILFNPERKVNIDISENLQRKFPQYKFLPLKGYTHDEMLELMNKSKLLIEFGNFPGAERIPKEAVICGMCVIANNEGSARFKKDVVIEDMYKFDGFENNQEEIGSLIVDIMENYENHVHNFDSYRETVYGLEENFIKRIRELFKKVD